MKSKNIFLVLILVIVVSIASFIFVNFSSKSSSSGNGDILDETPSVIESEPVEDPLDEENIKNSGILTEYKNYDDTFGKIEHLSKADVDEEVTFKYNYILSSDGHLKLTTATKTHEFEIQNIKDFSVATNEYMEDVFILTEDGKIYYFNSTAFEEDDKTVEYLLYEYKKIENIFTYSYRVFEDEEERVLVFGITEDATYIDLKDLSYN